MFAGAHLVDMVVNMRMNVAGNEDYDCKILHQQRKLFMTPMLDDDGGQYNTLHHVDGGSIKA